MSESCNHNCSECSANCSERTEDFTAKLHELSHVKKTIGILSGEGRRG